MPCVADVVGHSVVSTVVSGGEGVLTVVGAVGASLRGRPRFWDTGIPVFAGEVIIVSGAWDSWIGGNMEGVVDKGVNCIIEISCIGAISVIFLNLLFFIGLIDDSSACFFFLFLFFLRIVIGGAVTNLFSWSLFFFSNSTISLAVLDRYLILYY